MVDNSEFIREDIVKSFSRFTLEVHEYKDNEIIYICKHKIINDACDIFIIEDIENYRYKVKAIFIGIPNFDNDYLKKVYIDYAKNFYKIKFNIDENFDSYYLESEWIDRYELGEKVIEMIITSNDFSNHWSW